MATKEYVFDWYDKFEIKVIESKKNHEGYGGKKFINMPEYTFYVNLVDNWENDNHTITIHVPKLLRLLEKIHFLEDGRLPECFSVLERRDEDNGLNDICVGGVLSEITKHYREDEVDAKILLKANKAINEDRSPIFQRRIKWELKYDYEKQKHFVYGRFTTGII